MPDQNEEFRQQLLKVQEISPALRETYQRELETILQPPMTAQKRWVGTTLLIVFLVTLVLVVRADVVYAVRGLNLVAHIAFGAALLAASIYIIRDLYTRKYRQKSVYSIAMCLTIAAGTMTVIALMLGLRHQSDPKSLFGAFYVFVFYFACAMWALECRIASAELAAREQTLRIEYRLVDIADRMQK
jgi:hypothetical protein